jgi:hypothetical protein
MIDAKPNSSSDFVDVSGTYAGKALFSVAQL